MTGPMARTVEDLALMLSAIAKPDWHAPLSYLARPSFDGELAGSLAGVQIGWCPDLGGLPLEPEVLGVLAEAREQLTGRALRRRSAPARAGRCLGAGQRPDRAPPLARLIRGQVPRLRGRFQKR